MQGQGPSNIFLPSINYVLTEQVVYFFQILFLFTNNTSSVRSQVQSLQGKVNLDAKRLKQVLGVKIVPVAIGENVCVDDLKEIASMPDRVISCGVNEDPSKLGSKLSRGNFSIAYFSLLYENFSIS